MRRGHAADNTIASFRKALDLGCDEVETDVWLMPDGKMIIAHDPLASTVGLLTLDEVLDSCAGRMGVNVEPMAIAVAKTSSGSCGRETTGIIHINPNSIPSGIDRVAFASQKRAYWIWRAGTFE